MTVHNRKYFCYEIYKNISIWSKNGKLNYNPCSFYSGYIKSSDSFDIKNVWNSPEHTNLKEKIQNDIPISGCQTCYNVEKFGLESRRLGSKIAHETFFKDVNIDIDAPSSLDYSVGNLCNLKCIICNPNNSTAWLSDWQKLYPTKDVSIYKFDKFNQIEVDELGFLKNIKNIHFHGGGEPLLSTSHVNLLKGVQKAKGLQDVRVFYNTNGTVKVSDEVLNLWSECRLVELYFSIDDIGSRFEYQRTGANWAKIQDNLEWFRQTISPNHLFKVNCVWSYLNLYYLDELIQWHKSCFSTNRLGDATPLIFQKAYGECSIDSASNKVINTLLQKFQSYQELVNLVKTINPNEETTHDVFFSYINKLDKIRKTSFADICPDWFALLASTKFNKY
jgi:hypothetical protein